MYSFSLVTESDGASLLAAVAWVHKIRNFWKSLENQPGMNFIRNALEALERRCQKNFSSEYVELLEFLTPVACSVEQKPTATKATPLRDGDKLTNLCATFLKMWKRSCNSRSGGWACQFVSLGTNLMMNPQHKLNLVGGACVRENSMLVSKKVKALKTTGTAWLCFPLVLRPLHLICILFSQVKQSVSGVSPLKTFFTVI
jgi:hypothetical protein